MTITFRTLFLLILSALTVVSCGSDNDEKEDSPSNTAAPQEEEEDDTNRNIRYSAIVLEENCGFWTDCDFTVRSDLNRRPVILTANFIDNGFPHNEDLPNEIDVGQCNFQVTLTEAEADRLESLADKLRICRVENTPTADRGFDGLFTTDSSGREFMVYKFRDGGQEEEGEVNYLCAGRSAFYNYMGKLIVPEAPADCPSGYKRLFR